MKRGNMNTQSQHKSPIKKRRKGNSDDVQMIEIEDDSDDNPYAWTSDHEKIEVAHFSHDAWASDHEKIKLAEFFHDASIIPHSSDNEGV